jgi:hypothetical protein
MEFSRIVLTYIFCLHALTTTIYNASYGYLRPLVGDINFLCFPITYYLLHQTYNLNLMNKNQFYRHAILVEQIVKWNMNFFCLYIRLIVQIIFNNNKKISYWNGHSCSESATKIAVPRPQWYSAWTCILFILLLGICLLTEYKLQIKRIPGSSRYKTPS